MIASSIADTLGLLKIRDIIIIMTLSNPHLKSSFAHFSMTVAETSMRGVYILSKELSKFQGVSLENNFNGVF